MAKDVTGEYNKERKLVQQIIKDFDNFDEAGKEELDEICAGENVLFSEQVEAIEKECAQACNPDAVSPEQEEECGTDKACFESCFDGNLCNEQVASDDNINPDGTCQCSSDHTPLAFDREEYSACCPESGVLLPVDNPKACCPIGHSICCGLSVEECAQVVAPCASGSLVGNPC